jgi:hypothetical protein
MRRLIAILSALTILALPSAVMAQGRPFVTTLTGAAEVPGPGDPDGSGTAWITLNQGQSEVCWTIFVEDITLPSTGAHIHVGTVTESGGVVVALTAPDATGSASGCITADPELIKAIRQTPENYYVNVHTEPLYAAGALRGQLGR